MFIWTTFAQVFPGLLRVHIPLVWMQQSPRRTMHFANVAEPLQSCALCEQELPLAQSLMLHHYFVH